MSYQIFDSTKAHHFWLYSWGLNWSRVVGVFFLIYSLSNKNCSCDRLNYSHLTFSWALCVGRCIWLEETPMILMGLWAMYTLPAPLQNLTLSSHQQNQFSLWTGISEGKTFILKTQLGLSSVLMLTCCAVQCVHKQRGRVCLWEFNSCSFSSHAGYGQATGDKALPLFAHLYSLCACEKNVHSVEPPFNQILIFCKSF